MIVNPFRFVAFLYVFVITFICAHALYCSYTVTPPVYNLQNVLAMSLILNILFCIGLFRKLKSS